MEENGITLLMKAANAIDAELVCGFLEQEDILYMTKARGAGAMYCGPALCGVDVYVADKDFAAASQIVADVLSASPLIGDLPGLEDDE